MTFGPLKKQRAQGKPGADRTHGSRATKSTGVGPQVNRSKPAFPAQWFYGLLRALPGDRAFLPPSPPRSVLLGSLTPASGPGPHDFAVREFRRSSIASPASTASHRNVRDVRNAPHPDETAGLSPLICPTTEAEYFSAEGWTGQIGFIAFAKIDFGHRDLSAASAGKADAKSP